MRTPLPADNVPERTVTELARQKEVTYMPVEKEPDDGLSGVEHGSVGDNVLPPSRSIRNRLTPERYGE